MKTVHDSSMLLKNNLFGVCNKFISLGIRDNNPITPMKLQKLLYFTHAKLLQKSEHPSGLSPDLKFQAWEYGPVDSFVYDQFKVFSSRPIEKVVKYRNPDGTIEDIVPEDNLDDTINHIWDTLGKYSATQLSLLSHRKDSPWAMKYKDGIKHILIPNNLIKTYYSDAEKFKI